MQDLLKRISKLIDVKSIMTLALCFGFMHLTSEGQISGDQFLTIFTVVVSFYFGTVVEKNVK